MTDEELRRAFRDPSGASLEGCDLDAVWSGAAGDLDGEALSRVLAHVRGCGACAEAWALAREAQQGAASEASLGPDVVVPPAANRSLAWVAVVAAAVLVFVGLWALQWPSPPDVEPPVFRGDAEGIRAGVAEGARAEGRRLWWSPVPDTVRYQVVVLSPDLEVLHDARVDRAELVLPGSVPAGPVLWRVAAHRADGSVVESATFSAVVP